MLRVEVADNATLEETRSFNYCLDMKKQLIFEFEDGSAKSTGQRWDSMTTNFYSGDEVLHVFGGGDTVPFISGNSPGLIALGKLLIQMGMSDYKDGYHDHIYEDFDADHDHRCE
jgi:hypothetical protein